MKTNSLHGRRGYVSYLLVITTGICLTILMLHSYRKAMQSQQVQGTVSLKVDYREKQEALLRSIVAITPNRAARAMREPMPVGGGDGGPVSWRQIFNDALDQANARQSLSISMRNAIAANSISGNASDIAAGDINDVNVMIDPLSPGDGVVSAGVRQFTTPGYPAPLNWRAGAEELQTRDNNFPLISNNKRYGALAQGNAGVNLDTTVYQDFNQIRYPNINFGYAAPGEWFVAKRNWWAFTVDMTAPDAAATKAAADRREYVLSIYEVPSQLAISANTFTNLGQFDDDTEWHDRIRVSGRVYADRAQLGGSVGLAGLSARSEITGAGSIGAGDGAVNVDADTFDVGRREQYEFANGGASMPVSLATESGRAVFVPINRGVEFFDRYAGTNADPQPAVFSDTHWNDYSVGANRCAMRLDVIAVNSLSDQMPTRVRFSFLRGGVRVNSEHDIGFFNNDPTSPFLFSSRNDGVIRPYVEVSASKINAYITNTFAADNVSFNHSLAINVNYQMANNPTDGVRPRQPPALPVPGSDDILVVLKDCADLSAFTRGFSLVTNLLLEISDNFNTQTIAPPVGYVPPVGQPYYPPSSLFAPQKRWGQGGVDPVTLKLRGQIGAVSSNNQGTAAHIIGETGTTGTRIATNGLTFDLSPITHPGTLPPITMMNWLVTIEEKRAEFNAVAP